MMTVNEVAERLNVSPGLIYKLIASGELVPYRIAGAIRISEEELTEYLENCRGGRTDTLAPPRQRKHLKL